MNKILSCQYLRCLCVLCVFLSHIPFAHNVITDGQFGVALFMLMSGFFTMSSVDKKRYSLRKRILRILPLYWFLTVLLFVVALIKPNILNYTNPTVLNLIRSLLFIPYYVEGVGHKPIINVGWYLNIEIFISLIFSFTYLINKKKCGIFTATIILILFVLGLFCDFNIFFLKVYTSFYIIYYAIGIFMFYAYKNISNINLKLNHLLLNIFLLLIFPIGLLYFKYNFAFIVFTSFYFALVLLNRPIIFKEFFISVGNNSYPFYLLHYFIIAFIDRFIYRLNSASILSIIVTIICFIICYLLSIVATKCLERFNTHLKKF